MDLVLREAEASVALDGQTWTIDDRPPAWLFDIDGTLTAAWKYGDPTRRDWYDYEKSLQDDPHAATVHLALRLKAAGDVLLFQTTRPEQFREITRDYLRERLRLIDRDQPEDSIHLFMRPTGMDGVPDATIKRGQYRQLIQPHWKIRGVFEDQDANVEMYLGEGLNVMHVKGKGEY